MTDLAKLIERVDQLTAELEAATARADACEQQAVQWKGEALAHKCSLHEVYQALTGATGEPGNWNGARPVREFLQIDRDILTEGLRNWVHRRYGKWITHATAADFYRGLDIERLARLRALQARQQ